ncbi:MAG: hypothetical protein HKP58_11915 [Desulfatitalea sp.]|nr:TRL-like family protein [Desulfatitalea sp.]NNK01108.1 hypothetical protein [Desulfatitalea sp.]
MNRRHASGLLQQVMPLAAVFCLVLILSACSVFRPVGLIYTNIRLPLTKNLDRTPMPVDDPPSGRVLEVREPVTGLGIYAKVDSNAIGDIARENGMKTIYFADQHIFSILGIWSINKTVLYGE